jgi:hypothetical protein
MRVENDLEIILINVRTQNARHYIAKIINSRKKERKKRGTKDLIERRREKKSKNEKFTSFLLVKNFHNENNGMCARDGDLTNEFFHSINFLTHYFLSENPTQIYNFHT